MARRDPDPRSPVDWLLSVCTGLFMASLALYGAVYIVGLVWQQLAIGAAVIGVVWLLGWLVWRRWLRW